MTEPDKNENIEHLKKIIEYIPVIIFFVAVVINLFIGIFPNEQLMYAGVFVFIGGLAGGSTIFLLKSKDLKDHTKSCGICIKNLNSSLNTLKEIQDVTLKHFEGSVISFDKLKEIESKVEAEGKIWILTSALDLDDEDFNEIIINNLKKGVQYVYLLPKEDNDLLEGIMKNLADTWKKRCQLSDEDAKRQISCLMVPSHYVYMTVVIYNAQNSENPNPNLKPTVIVKFPTNKIYPQKTYSLVYRVQDHPDQAWQVFVISIKRFINRKTGCAQPIEELDLFKKVI